jgi:hypothetical protein
MRMRRVVLVVVVAVTLGSMSSISMGAITRAKPPKGFHIVKLKKAGISLAVPNKWIIIGKGDPFSAGDPSVGKIILAGLKKKGVKELPSDPTLQDITIAGKPAKVGVETDSSGVVATSFYLLSKKGGVVIVCTGPVDARQDPTFQTMIKSVKLLK